MVESDDRELRSVFGLPAWIQTRWPERLLFLLLGVWTCSVACVFGVAFFHDGTRAWRENSEALHTVALLGSCLGLFAPLMLMRSDVRRSAPFVWLVTVASTAIGLWLGERLHWDLALLFSPLIGGFIACLAARRWFRWA
jgi:uncharacterized membrane protein YsdA (DUF1294 family)